MPAIASDAGKRAKQLNLPLSTYVTILLWNFAQAPVRGLQAEPASPQLARVHVPCTIRQSAWSLVRPLVPPQLSANAFIESLIARDLRTGPAGLLILAARGSTRRRLE